MSRWFLLTLLILQVSCAGHVQWGRESFFMTDTVSKTVEVKKESKRKVKAVAKSESKPKKKSKSKKIAKTESSKKSFSFWNMFTGNDAGAAASNHLMHHMPTPGF